MRATIEVRYQVLLKWNVGGLLTLLLDCLVYYLLAECTKQDLHVTFVKLPTVKSLLQF